ncbi:MAG: helix-turn-helix domain-containing protein [Hyphomicrobiales bacterium]
MARKTAPHMKLGKILAAQRLEAGFSHQRELAKKLNVVQQTVSRWEHGSSRPRPDQIPAVAAALKIEPDKLFLAAGYTAASTTVSFDQSFPVDALSPESFERFIQALLQVKYRGASVHRFGGPGHKQDGLDIDVGFSNGTTFTFQCKREAQFGPSKVRSAIAKHTRKAKKRFIVLSRIATPAARLEIKNHRNWSLWDKEDISNLVRELPKEEQRRLVDTFFPGQRIALLGESESGPWQTLDEFFAPFIDPQGSFNHSWDLVGREDELLDIGRALADANVAIVSIIGAGGSGKTRLLKAVLENFSHTNPDALIRVLSPTEQLTRKSLDDLGSASKLLVVDDAHDREIDLLYQFVASRPQNTKLIITARPYGATRIQTHTARFGIIGHAIVNVSLKPLSKEQAAALATCVLKARGGPLSAAVEIAESTRDNALAVVMGSHVVAKSKKHLQLAKNEQDFRSSLLKSFWVVASGAIWNPADQERLHRLLRILALLQPFVPDDPALLKSIYDVEKIEGHEVSRLIRVLRDGGILFKRSGRYRLSPDVLADHLIEEKCIDVDGKSTGYAELVFDNVDGDRLEHLVLNIGKLDWSRSNGASSNSKLLDGIWEKLRPTGEFGDHHLKAITEVAFFQPERALVFVEKCVRRRFLLEKLPNVLKLIAYDYSYLTKASELLWLIGSADERDFERHHDHGIQVLKSLCQVSNEKPRKYIDLVVDFGLSLVADADAWKQKHSPLDFVAGILDADFQQITHGDMSVTLTNFGVAHAFVASIRGRVINAILDLLNSENPVKALAGARYLSNALKYPMTGKGERAEWTREFSATLKMLKQKVDTEHLSPVVLLEIARSISWHAHYGSGSPKAISRSIFDSLPNSIEFRTALAMLEGFGTLKAFRSQKTGEDFQSLISELNKQFASSRSLYNFIRKVASGFASLPDVRQVSCRPFLRALFSARPDVAALFAKLAISEPADRLSRHADLAFGCLLLNNRRKALELAENMLRSADVGVVSSVGYGFGLVQFEYPPTERELSILIKLVSSQDERVVQSGVAAFRSLVDYPKSLLELLGHAEIGLDASLANNAMMYICWEKNKVYQILGQDDVKMLFQRLFPLKELRGHWIDVFLATTSKDYAWICLNFFIQRIERADEQEDWGLKPCTGAFASVGLCFRQADEFAPILDHVLKYIITRKNPTALFTIRSGELFNAMFPIMDVEIVSRLQKWVRAGDETALKAIGGILRDAPHDFVFDQQDFAAELLERASTYGPGCYQTVMGHLYAASISNLRSGEPGKEFPQDLELKRAAQEALSKLSRFSAARELYNQLGEYAQGSIEFSTQDELLDD